MIYNGNVFIKKIKAPVYRTSIWIVICKSMTKAAETVEDMTDVKIPAPEPSTDARMFAYEEPSGKYHMIIFLRPNAKPGRVAHECKHLINVLFMWHGAYFSMKNDELECYYLDWLVDRAHETITQYRRVSKKNVKKF